MAAAITDVVQLEKILNPYRTMGVEEIEVGVNYNDDEGDVGFTKHLTRNAFIDGILQATRFPGIKVTIPSTSTGSPDDGTSLGLTYFSGTNSGAQYELSGVVTVSHTLCSKCSLDKLMGYLR